MVSKIKCFFLFFLLISSVVFSQNTDEKIVLKSLFSQLEAKYQVKFSYSDADVNNIYIKEPDENFTLEELLEFLNKNTLLQFQTLDKRYITVSFLNKTVDVCGNIFDEGSKEPLGFASIKIDGLAKGTSTNSDGFFNLTDVPVNAILVISYISFQDKKIAIKELFSTDDCKTIYLKEVTEQLSEISIPNFLTSGLQRKLDGSTVLNTENFGILPGLIEPDILQTIKILPGVESASESISNINVRGGTHDQNLMIWDGIKMYHTGHFFGLISAYNPFLTKNVTVTKNGTSSQFSDGVSSTINMESNNTVTGDFEGGAGFNLLSADFYVNVPVAKNLDVAISGRRSFTDFVNTPTFDNYFERSFQENTIANNNVNKTESDFHFYDYSFKVLYDVSYNHAIRANVIGIKNSLDYREIFEENNTTVEENSNLQQENLGAKISWLADWNAKFSTEFSSFFSDYNINSSDFNRNTNQLQTQLNNVLETAIQFNTFYTFSKELKLSNGYVFNEIGVRNSTTVNAPSFETTNKEVLLKHAVFSEIEFNKNKTFACFGVRGNYFSKFNEFLFEPRLNIRQGINDEFAVKLEGEFKNQTTTQRIDFQDNFLGIERRRWVLSNGRNIPIVKSQQVSFGVEFNKNRWFVDITGFYKFVDDITASNQGFYNNVQTFNAVGNYEIHGVEFLVNKKTDKISTWLSYTYSQNTSTFDIFSPESFPNNLDITHSLSNAFNYNFTDDLQISLGTILRSGRPFTKPVVGNETLQNGNETIVNYENPNQHRLPNFFRFDVSGSYGFNLYENVNGKIRLGFTNITNRKNIIDSYFVVDNSSANNVRRIDINSLPFTPNLSFRVDF